eukprot:gene23131-30334_t
MQSKLGTSCDTACSLQDMDCDLPAIKALKDSAFAAIGVTCEKTVDRGGNSYFKYAPSVCTSSALCSTSFGLCNIASSTTCDAADDRIEIAAHSTQRTPAPAHTHQRQHMRLLATLAESTSPQADHDRDDGGSSIVSSVSLRTVDLLARSFAVWDAGMSPSSKTGYSTPNRARPILPSMPV